MLVSSCLSIISSCSPTVPCAQFSLHYCRTPGISSVLFCSVLFCSVLFCSVLFCSFFLPSILFISSFSTYSLHLPQTARSEPEQRVWGGGRCRVIVRVPTSRFSQEDEGNTSFSTVTNNHHQMINTEGEERAYLSPPNSTSEF